MLWSFEALLRFARRAVPSALVNAEAWPPEALLSRDWPQRAASIGGVECRLGASSAPPDLAFCVSAATGGRDALGSELARGDVGHDDDAGARRFLGHWADPTSAFHAHIPLVWLEFDHGPLSSGRALPFVVLNVGASLSEPQARDGLVTLVADAVADLTGRALDAGATHPLRRFLAALPGSGRLCHAAVMPHRGSGALRLVVSMPRSEAQEFLERLEWRGPAAIVGETLAEVWPNDQTVSLNLDLADEVGVRIGVELYRPTSPREDPRWRHLLGMLVAADACTEAQRAALEDWPSREMDSAPDSHPHLLRHLLMKLLFEPREPVRAKAYLAFIPQWQPFGSPERTRPPIEPGR